ncbi:hypothetical protein CDAR_417511 [Caerostris darwini]|uniref:Uncharacterized protein n=1 Tax=Caerostris darwini TaxID=1538125 RepID=A0AAV4WFV3_9ARAC|nr:hypothetical protein CDAR_417511 [Caerostris darwini]
MIKCECLKLCKEPERYDKLFQVEQTFLQNTLKSFAFEWEKNHSSRLRSRFREIGLSFHKETFPGNEKRREFSKRSESPSGERDGVGLEKGK